MSGFEIERPPRRIIEDLSKMYSGIIQDACDEVLGQEVRTWRRGKTVFSIQRQRGLL